MCKGGSDAESWFNSLVTGLFGHGVLQKSLHLKAAGRNDRQQDIQWS
jgi:hypothetical protein